MSEGAKRAPGITAVVLAGGKGTRLAPVLPDVPKVLAPVNGRPFLAWLLDLVSASGVSTTVLCTGYKAPLVEETMGARHQDMALVYSREHDPLDTGGALRLALDHIPTETVLAMNGDSFVNADLPAYFSWFAQKEIKAGMLVVRVPDTARYGRVKFLESGRITGFSEKGAARGQGWINAGMYLLNKSLVSSIVPEKRHSLERDFFPQLARQGLLFGHASQGDFLDIGTPETFKQAGTFFKKKETKTL